MECAYFLLGADDPQGIFADQIQVALADAIDRIARFTARPDLGPYSVGFPCQFGSQCVVRVNRASTDPTSYEVGLGNDIIRQIIRPRILLVARTLQSVGTGTYPPAEIRKNGGLPRQ